MFGIEKEIYGMKRGHRMEPQANITPILLNRQQFLRV